MNNKILDENRTHSTTNPNNINKKSLFLFGRLSRFVMTTKTRILDSQIKKIFVIDIVYSRTNILIFVVIMKTFRPLCSQTFFGCLLILLSFGEFGTLRIQ